MDMIRIGKCIAEARKKAGMTQSELAEKTGVSVQAVSKWENGHNLPDIENLMQISEFTNTPYSFLLGEIDPSGSISYTFRDRLFREENMYTRMRTTASVEGLTETLRALSYMRERHSGQFRKKQKFTSSQVLYINHPLIMACHAHALGVRDDALMAAILLHDVVEDTGVTAEEMPFSEEVKRIVSLVSFSVPSGKTKSQAKKEYYEQIGTNPKACVVKIIDRCNNISTMAATFSNSKMIDYIKETEKYILPLTDILKNQYPEYSNLAFLVKYQILSVLETVKNLLAS